MYQRTHGSTLLLLSTSIQTDSVQVCAASGGVASRSIAAVPVRTYVGAFSACLSWAGLSFFPRHSQHPYTRMWMRFLRGCRGRRDCPLDLFPVTGKLSGLVARRKGTYFSQTSARTRPKTGTVKTNLGTFGRVYLACFSQKRVWCGFFINGLDQSEKPSEVYLSARFGCILVFSRKNHLVRPSLAVAVD